jgi:hypothetical protein
MKHQLKSWKAESILVEFLLKNQKNSAVGIEDRAPSFDFRPVKPCLKQFWSRFLGQFALRFEIWVAGFMYLLITYLLITTALLAQPIDLRREAFEHVHFRALPQTVYSTSSGHTLSAEVQKSASFLLKSFDAALQVSRLRLVWRSSIDLSTKTPPSAIKTKNGDDAVLKIGLLLKGVPPFMPIFAPSWIKQVKHFLKVPTDRMIWMIVGSGLPDREEWVSPWNSRIKNVAVAGSLSSDGWYLSVAEFEPLSLVGLAIMADGDNTSSSFKTDLKELSLQ